LPAFNTSSISCHYSGVGRRWTFWGTPASGLDVAVCARSQDDVWLEVTEPLYSGWEALHTLRLSHGAFRPAPPVLYKHADPAVEGPCPKKIRRSAKVERHLDEIRAALDSWAEEDLQLTNATGSMDRRKGSEDASAEKHRRSYIVFSALMASRS
jgi:hypothetical protein